jgi:ArsR family transcriptional regulator
MKKSKSKSDAALNLDMRAKIFKALGHPTRLLIMNLIHMKPRHGEELAEILKLKPATISHHLAQLSSAGLLQSKKDQYYQIYSLRADALQSSLLEMITLPQPEIHATLETDAYRQKVIDTFFEFGRLKQIPAQLKKRQVILEKIVQEFEPARQYSEIEVNRILLEFHEDVATLRRELVAETLMERENGIYWRTQSPG